MYATVTPATAGAWRSSAPGRPGWSARPRFHASTRWCCSTTATGWAATSRSPRLHRTESGWQSLLNYYASAIDRAGNIDVRRHAASLEDLLEGFDHVVLALGSEEIIPDLPGADRAMTTSRFIERRTGAGSGGGAGDRR